MAKDYVPEKDSDFNSWQKSFVDYIIANASALVVSTSEKNKLVSLRNSWKTDYLNHLTAQNAAKGATETKEETRDSYETAIRQLTRKFQARAETTDSQREGLGITVPDRIRTPLSEQIVQSESPPKVKARCTSPKQVRIDWYPSQVGTDSGAKPKGIDGVAIWYAEGGIPTDNALWRFLALDTNSPYIHSVGNNATVTLAYKAQWFDKRKRMGAFGNPVTVAVTA
ncbi:hypothetical protein KAW50_02215 [candidate division WOR-3 bacterium]|nr:hypothetical protein [candidate division WOR-3 bacterium]